MTEQPDGVIACTADDLHPYGCLGESGGCIHCQRVTSDEHNPRVCPVCIVDVAEWTDEEWEAWEAAPLADGQALDAWRQAVRGWA